MLVTWSSLRTRGVRRRHFVQSKVRPFNRLLSRHSGTRLAYDNSGQRKHNMPRRCHRAVKSWIQVRDASTGTLLKEFSGHAGLAWKVAFSLDARWLASAGGEFGRPGEVLLWNLTRDEEPKRLPVGSVGVFCLIFSSDGRQFAAGSVDRLVRVWNVDSGELIHELGPLASFPSDVAYRQDRSLLACVSIDGPINVWDLDAARVAKTWNSGGTIFGISFSPDNSRLATAGPNNRVTLWDADTGLEALELAGHTSPASPSSFKRLITIRASTELQ